MRFLALFFSLLLSVTLSAQFSDLNIVVDNASMSDFEVVDFDGDGDLDLVGVGDRSIETQLFWVENMDGLGTMSVPRIIQSIDDLDYVSVGDINGDGTIDLVANELRNGQFYEWHENLGGGSSFVKHPNHPFSQGAQYYEPELVDLDNDGDLDIFSVSRNSSINTPLRWSENTDGLGDFNDLVQLMYLDGDTVLIDAYRGDMDADGDWDMVAVINYELDNEELYHLVWYEQTAPLNFSTSKYISPITEIEQLLLGDINGNGFTDVLLAKSNDTIVLMTNSGNPNNLSPEQTIGTYSLSREMALKDIDGDNDLDVVLCAMTTKAPGWIENQGNASQWLEHLFPESHPFSNIRFGDLDNDGLEDLIFNFGTGSSKSQIFWFPRLTSSGGFDVYQNILNHDFSIAKIIPYDLDNDDDLDIISLVYDDGSLAWYEQQDGDHQFADRVSLVESRFVFRSAIVADINNNGNGDLFYCLDKGLFEPSRYYLYWKPHNATLLQFDDPILIDSSLLTIAHQSGDMDGDGDLDLVISLWPEGMLWLEYNASGNDFTKHIISTEPLGSSNTLFLEDVEGDGDLDLFYNNNEGIFWIKHLGGDNFAAPIQIDFNFSAGLSELNLGDHDGDGDLDVYGRQNGFGNDDDIVYLFLFNQTTGAFEEEIQISDHIDVYSMHVADLDGDGYTDVIGENGWLKNLEGTGIYSQLFPMEYSSKNNLQTADLNGDNDLDLIFSINGGGIYYFENQVDTVSWVRGHLFIDLNSDCNKTDSTEVGLEGWTVEVDKPNGTEYFPTLDNGSFIFYVSEPGDYEVHITPIGAYWVNCFNDSTIQITDEQDIYLIDWPVQPLVDCPLVKIDVDGWAIRSCRDNTVQIHYCNLGTQVADTVVVEVVLDAFVELTDSDIPVSGMTDSSYFFILEEPLGIGECGSFRVFINPDCDNTEIGDLVCIDVYVTPDSLCLPPNSSWDGSTIEVSGYCVEDSIVFELRNIGWGDMSEIREYQSYIVNDDIVMLHGVDTFNLNAGAVKEIKIPSVGLATRLEAEQDPLHPLAVNPGVVVNDCEAIIAGLGLNLIFEFPDEDGDPFTEQFCKPIIGSYDPNDKTASPEGFGPEHLIANDWELDYQIRFQNTGNDTAFLVVIRDTLSEYLDLSSFKIGVASHPFTWLLDTERVLTLTFENILLPDSTTNLIESQGFIKYQITPEAELPPLSVINNRAGIYFDFNDPIITNTVFHTIRKPIAYQAEYINICAGESYDDLFFLSDTTLIDTFSTVWLDSFVFQHLHILDTFRTFVDTNLVAGDFWNDQIINADTTFIDSLQSISGCDSLVVVQIDLLTSINNLNDLAAIAIYPNPTKGWVTIKQLEPYLNIQSIRLYSTQGQEQLLLKGAFPESYQLDLRAYKSGIYWLELQTDAGPLIERLVLFAP